MGGEPPSGRFELSFGLDGGSVAIQYLRFQSGLFAEQGDDFRDVIHDVSSLSEVAFVGFGDVSFVR